jgi:hypothetical protein
MAILACTPQVRSKQVVTTERCRHCTRLGYQTQAWLMAWQTRSTPSIGTDRGATRHLLTNRCIVEKLLPHPRTSKARNPRRAFQTRYRGRRFLLCSLIPKDRNDVSDRDGLFVPCVTNASLRRRRKPAHAGQGIPRTGGHLSGRFPVKC